MSWGKIIMLLIFTTVMVFVSIAVSALITVRCTATTDLSGWTRILIGCGIALIFVSPFLLRYPSTPGSGSIYNALTYITYFLFVCVFLFFCLMIARDITWIIGKWLIPALPSPFRATVVAKANLALLFLVIALSAYSLYEGMRVPRIKEVTLYSTKITSPLKIVSLPDIHIHRALSARKLKGIIQATNNLKPDIIALPGDIIDDRADTIKDLVSLLHEFKSSLGTYVTDGNHEIYTGTKEAQHQFKKERITYLHNEAQRVRPDVIVVGVPDIQSSRIGLPPDMKKALPQTDSFTILLAHSPKMFDMPDNTADLQLSGHTHGGQIFPFHILTWLSNHHYLAGLYQDGNRNLYVSRGAGQWGPQMRLLAPSEISVINVLPKK